MTRAVRVRWAACLCRNIHIKVPLNQEHFIANVQFTSESSKKSLKQIGAERWQELIEL
jgi:hypothetical protein